MPDSFRLEVAGFSWQQFCSPDYSAGQLSEISDGDSGPVLAAMPFESGSPEAVAVVAALIEGSGFTPQPLEPDEQICFWVGSPSSSLGWCPTAPAQRQCQTQCSVRQIVHVSQAKGDKESSCQPS